MSHWGGASEPPIGREEGDFRPPPTPTCTAQSVRDCSSPANGKPALDPWHPPTAPFPHESGFLPCFLCLPVACHSGVYTRIRIPLLWRINLQEFQTELVYAKPGVLPKLVVNINFNPTG